MYQFYALFLHRQYKSHYYVIWNGDDGLCCCYHTFIFDTFVTQIYVLRRSIMNIGFRQKSQDDINVIKVALSG